MHIDCKLHTHYRLTALRPGDYPGGPVPEETFTHSHPSWSSDILYQLLPPTMINSILILQFQCLTALATTSLQVHLGLPLVKEEIFIILKNTCMYRSFLTQKYRGAKTDRKRMYTARDQWGSGQVWTMQDHINSPRSNNRIKQEQQ